MPRKAVADESASVCLMKGLMKTRKTRLLWSEASFCLDRYLWVLGGQAIALPCPTGCCTCREDEEAAAAYSAYQREFKEDHSWEQLREDEFGRLVALVTTPASRHPASMQTSSSDLALQLARRNAVISVFNVAVCCGQDVREEQRAKRKRLLGAAASSRIRRGLIRYVLVCPAVCACHACALCHWHCAWPT